MSRLFLAKRVFSGLTGTRAFSESPRITIAKNLLKLNAVRAATDEASLQKALTANYDVDFHALPGEIQPLGSYFAAAPAAGATGGFVQDKTAWQNMNLLDYVGTESQRDETWPFLVGYA